MSYWQQILVAWLVPILQTVDLFVQGFSGQALAFTILSYLVYGGSLAIVLWQQAYIKGWYHRHYPEAAKLTLKRYEFEAEREKHNEETNNTSFATDFSADYLSW